MISKIFVPNSEEFGKTAAFNSQSSRKKQPWYCPWLGHWTDNFLYEYRKAQRRIQSKGQSLVDRYSPTQVGESNDLSSIYVDAAFSNITCVYFTAFAIYDPGGGGLLAAGYRKIKLPGFVMEAELHATHDGFLFAKRNIVGPLRVFSDSIQAINSIQSDKHYKGVEEAIIKDI